MRFISAGSAPLMRLGLLSGFEQFNHMTGHFPHHSWHKLNETDGRKYLKQYFEEYKPNYLIAAGYAPKYFEYIEALCKKDGVGFIYWAI